MSLFSKQKLNELQAKESSTKQHIVLIVDDEESNRKVMAAVLKDHYQVLETEDAIAALELIENMEHPEQISMVISDQRMPNMTGVELFERLTEIIPKTIRIIVTGFIDVESIIDSVNKAHIYKFILKPFERVDFLWTAKRAVESFELQKKLDDHLLSLEHQVVENTTELAQKNDELQQAYGTLEDISLTDQLTQLKSRHFLSKYLKGDTSQLLHPPGSVMIFFLIDLDRFKLVNEVYGQAAGDGILKAIKPLFEQVFSSTDYMVRWGGEEFLVVVRSPDGKDGPVLAEKLRTLMASHAFEVAPGKTLNKTCSIGYAHYPFIKNAPDCANWEQVVCIADRALSVAKNNGRNAWVGINAPATLEDGIVVEQALDDFAGVMSQQTLEYQSSVVGEIDFS
ncbi:MAG: diguanylate cyclase (GGDEF)-like protein [Phenylobacterium sp.]|jgi:diguanylate cyclase (GGDEF)-like protein